MRFASYCDALVFEQHILCTAPERGVDARFVFECKADFGAKLDDRREAA
jgi:hypothetical protein